MNVLLVLLTFLTCPSDHRFRITPPKGYDPVPLVLPTGVQGKAGREVKVRIRDGRIER